MTQANDSVAVTPGSGATIATHLANSKEYQVVMLAKADGHIEGTKDTWLLPIASQVFVASANTVHWDIFNADATVLVRVQSVLHIPDMVTAVATGVATSWKLARTTAVGTGGSTLTPIKADTNQSAIDADITARSKPTGGATEGDILRYYYQHGEESNTGTIITSALGGIELLPRPVYDNGGLILRQNQGLRAVQITSTALGNAAFLLTFTTE